MTRLKDKWRVGSKVPINVYDGDRPVCQCQTAADARRIVDAVNAALAAAVCDLCGAPLTGKCDECRMNLEQEA